MTDGKSKILPEDLELERVAFQWVQEWAPSAGFAGASSLCMLLKQQGAGEKMRAEVFQKQRNNAEIELEKLGIERDRIRKRLEQAELDSNHWRDRLRYALSMFSGGDWSDIEKTIAQLVTKNSDGVLECNGMSDKLRCAEQRVTELDVTLSRVMGERSVAQRRISELDGMMCELKSKLQESFDRERNVVEDYERIAHELFGTQKITVDDIVDAIKALRRAKDAPQSPVGEISSPRVLTPKELQSACRNIGVDLECGACASIFYTGIKGPESHTCKMSVLRNLFTDALRGVTQHCDQDEEGDS